MADSCRPRKVSKAAYEIENIYLSWSTNHPYSPQSIGSLDCSASNRNLPFPAATVYSIGIPALPMPKPQCHRPEGSQHDNCTQEVLSHRRILGITEQRADGTGTDYAT